MKTKYLHIENIDTLTKTQLLEELRRAYRYIDDADEYLGRVKYVHVTSTFSQYALAQSKCGEIKEYEKKKMLSALGRELERIVTFREYPEENFATSISARVYVIAPSNT